MSHFQLEPEVAGGWGANTEADTSKHPPVVSKLHYEFSGWLGDCLLESFPCFIATNAVIDSLSNVGISGFEVREVEVTTSEQFRDLSPQRALGDWKWLIPTGVLGQADIALTANSTLVVSERALQVFQKHGLLHCDIDKYQGEQGGRGDAEPDS